MERLSKRLLRISLLTTALVAALVVSASALTEGDWTYQLLGSEAYITDYNGEASGSITVPSKLNGATVTKMDSLDMLNGASSITVPGTIKEVNCSLSYGWEELESLTLGEGVQSYEGCILQKFPNLTTVSLPSTLKTLSDYAFLNCGLTQIKLPAGLQSIGSQAFSSTSLSSVDMSALTSLTKMGAGIFSDCKSLESIKLPSNMTTIPQSLVENCTNLTSIDIPATVTAIKTSAFRDTGLTQVYLPVGLKTINPGAFINTNLTEVIIPYGATEVGSGSKYTYGVFGNCSNLKAVYIPSTVQSMGTAIISDCPDAIIYCASGSYAESFCKKNSISYQIDASVNTCINVLYNGKRISFGETGQNPVIENGRTLVPLRSIFETMDASVDWDAATRTVTATRGSDTIKLTLGDRILYKNGKAVMTMDVPAKTLNGRTVVPARAAAESFGATVGWIGSAQIVTITE